MSGSNALMPPATWAPSTWQPGQLSTPRTVDTSAYPMPTAEQIAAQRALILRNLAKYGYQPQQLTDAQVLSTMSNLPQGPVQMPDWAEDWLRRNPQESDRWGARPGVDLPYNQTFEESNLRTPALNTAVPTSIGYANAIHRGALLEHYGPAWLQQHDLDQFAQHGGNPANMATVVYGNPGGVQRYMPGETRIYDAQGIPIGRAPNPLQP